ncbi:MAG: TIM barrel protein [Anaerolineae bacterium]|nr:TIM barrel protein [Anaerolineae bacterium]
MRLGISSFTYSWAIGVPHHLPQRRLGVIGLLDKALELGVRLIQVADNLPLDRVSSQELDAFRTRAAHHGIQIEVGTRGIAPNHLLRYLELAQYFASPILRVVVDTADHHPDAEEIVATLRGVISKFEEAEVCLAIENHDRFKARTLADIVNRIGSQYVGICLDTVNSFGAQEGPETVLEVLGPLTVNLHIKDFAVIRAKHNMGFTIEGRPAGQGQLDIPWLLQELNRMGRDVNAILELWTPPQERLEDTIALEDTWARASIAYLRSLITN